MKYVREHINEVFTNDSDPIQDLGIGGVIPANVHYEILNNARNEWFKWLEQFVGKKIKGKFHKGGFQFPEGNYAFHVKSTMSHFERDKTKPENIITSPYFAFVSEEDNIYYSHGKEKFFVVE